MRKVKKARSLFVFFQRPTFRRMPRATVPNRVAGRLGKWTVWVTSIHLPHTQSLILSAPHSCLLLEACSGTLKVPLCPHYPATQVLSKYQALSNSVVVLILVWTYRQPLLNDSPYLPPQYP